MKFFVLELLFLVSCCVGRTQDVRCGADLPERYMGLLEGQKIGLVVNHSSRVGEQHLLDFLLDRGVSVQKVFCPEHGFRGDADAGELIGDQVDEKTGIPVVSLYGKNKKPTTDQLKGIDLLVFDIQDVGVRFYTYLSTLHYVMEACAENQIPLLLLDRPNPNGDYIAGPVLDLKFQSFVGMHPIPIVHGCTLGEMALMINGQHWLKDSLQCRVTVVPVENYTHQTPYSLPVKPSPNLPNDLSIRLYPSLCFFEATTMSIGRGTQFPFQVVGYPDRQMGYFQFTPKSIPGMAKKPKQEGKTCYGEDLRGETLSHRFSLGLFLKYYHHFKKEPDFLSSPNWLNLLAGTDELLNQIRSGATLGEIEDSWQKPLEDYRNMRRNYLLYPDENPLK
ncbi:exo-beta-N-acetylmuramidase NamZ domain-containing protein [Mangrovibacterium sp.]|uniref:exo-beta-N-acetylmuramidase NamZ family protein n=1 Tax=Mangrovibacterium sp. TaxID=1961364 RepID=UPI003568E563